MVGRGEDSGRNEEVIEPRYLKVATWLPAGASIPPVSIEARATGRSRKDQKTTDVVGATMGRVRGREETSSSNLRRSVWSIHIRKGRHWLLAFDGTHQ